uniref:Uncharacterized protein n=1 Tax=Anguilla anguilla TaxID=7936 RepID=A0A0E9U222_ANGAN
MMAMNVLFLDMTCTGVPEISLPVGDSL